jgi:hypothetical protein
MENVDHKHGIGPMRLKRWFLHSTLICQDNLISGGFRYLRIEHVTCATARTPPEVATPNSTIGNDFHNVSVGYFFAQTNAGVFIYAS